MGYQDGLLHKFSKGRDDRFAIGIDAPLGNADRLARQSDDPFDLVSLVGLWVRLWVVVLARFEHNHIPTVHEVGLASRRPIFLKTRSARYARSEWPYRYIPDRLALGELGIRSLEVLAAESATRLAVRIPSVIGP